jgi:hypothetical protein
MKDPILLMNFMLIGTLEMNYEGKDCNSNKGEKRNGNKNSCCQTSSILGWNEQ